MRILNYQPGFRTGRFSRVALFLTCLTIGAAGFLIPAGARGSDSGQVYKVGENGVSPPVLMSKTEPQYTKAAHDAHIQGAVQLHLVIDDSGLPQNVTVVKGLDPGLDENAVDAVRQWRFQPGKKDGKPVAVEARIEVQFRLL